MSKRKGKFQIKRLDDGQWHFVLKAPNGRVILQSETYKSKAGAENGIRSIKENAPGAEVEILD